MCGVDEAFGALADERRRLVLFCLRRHRSVSLADLAELVVEAESGRDLADVPDEQVRDVYMSLYHTHVPRLVEAGLARYDQESDLAASREDGVETLERLADELDALLDPLAEDIEPGED